MSTKLKKRIFLNLDGTGQSAFTKQPEVVGGIEISPYVSNVARIGRATLLQDEENGFEQITYYQTGLGADAEKDANTLDQISQGGRGIGVTSNVREAYGFLCNNYDFGDEIYITGFSRGAFTARSVAGLIGTCGILTRKGLGRFYETLQYYKYSYDKSKTCPISEEDGTTRLYIPGSNPKERIKIRAVGVWDTVGALDHGAFRFHDVALGDFIENAWHCLALNEHRVYFDCVLWEDPNRRRSTQNFEQCWMVGDHSNVGGSWPDQQLSDISLAWMMSKFEALGVKFDQTYLYQEYVKYKTYMKTIAPKLNGTNAQGPAYDPKMNPRTWGEGRTHNMWKEADGILTARTLTGGTMERTPGKYCAPKWTSDTAWKNGDYLKNTNETIHPAVRYRHFCKKSDHLGYCDKEKYDPACLRQNWTYPKTPGDGRIGQGAPTPASGPLVYGFDRDPGKPNATKIPFTETTMGKHDLLYLAFYDQDPDMKQPNGLGIWKQVVGGDGPPQDILDSLKAIINDHQNPKKPSAPAAENIYIGKKPATADDVAAYSPYQSQAHDIKVGTWNGAPTSIDDAKALFPFTSLDRIKVTGEIKSLRGVYDQNADAITYLLTRYADNGTHQIGGFNFGAGLATPTTLADFGLQNGEKFVKMESKAKAPKGKDGLQVVALKFTTDKGREFKLNADYDKIADAQVVVESPPSPGWELKGFYGAFVSTSYVVVRLGPIWGRS